MIHSLKPMYLNCSHIFILVFFFISRPLPVFAQEECHLTLPSETTVISKNPWAEKLGKDKTYWICNQAQVIFRAGNATIFVDAGAKVTVGHGKYTVYLKKYASLIVNSGAKVNVYYEKGASIQNTGLTGVATKISCLGLVLDLSQAPTGICPSPTSIEINVQNTQNKPEDPLSITEDTSQVTGLSVKPYYANLKESHIIPTQARVIPFKIRVEKAVGDNQVFWLCENAKLLYSGNNSIFYLEEGSVLEITLGDNNIIYSKNGVKLDLGYGQNHKIFYEEGVTLGRDQSQKTRFTKLLEMEFDYENAPEEGCN